MTKTKLTITKTKTRMPKKLIKLKKTTSKRG